LTLAAELASKRNAIKESCSIEASEGYAMKLNEKNLKMMIGTLGEEQKKSLLVKHSDALSPELAEDVRQCYLSICHEKRGWDITKLDLSGYSVKRMLGMSEFDKAGDMLLKYALSSGALAQDVCNLYLRTSKAKLLWVKRWALFYLYRIYVEISGMGIFPYADALDKLLKEKVMPRMGSANDSKPLFLFFYELLMEVPSWPDVELEDYYASYYFPRLMMECYEKLTPSEKEEVKKILRDDYQYYYVLWHLEDFLVYDLKDKLFCKSRINAVKSDAPEIYVSADDYFFMVGVADENRNEIIEDLSAYHLSAYYYIDTYTLCEHLTTYGQWDEAISLLRKCVDAGWEYPYSTLEKSYIAHASKEGYASKLKNYIMEGEFDGRKMSAANELRLLIDEDAWQEFYKQFRAGKHIGSRSLFEEVGDYAAIMDGMEDGTVYYSPDSENLVLRTLKDLYPDRLYEWIGKSARKMMDGMDSQFPFESFVEALKMLSWYEGGKDKAQQLANEALGRKYRTKRRLVKQLREAGFCE